jgi:hypothetical protein
MIFNSVERPNDIQSVVVFGFKRFLLAALAARAVVAFALVGRGAKVALPVNNCKINCNTKYSIAQTPITAGTSGKTKHCLQSPTPKGQVHVFRRSP